MSKDALVVEADTVIVVHEGRYYPMCCEKCEPEFKSDPAKYADTE